MFKKVIKTLIFLIAIFSILSLSGCIVKKGYGLEINRSYYFTFEESPVLDAFVYESVKKDIRGGETYTLANYTIYPQNTVDTSKTGKQTFTIQVYNSDIEYTVDVWVLQLEEGVYCDKIGDGLYTNPTYVNNLGKIVDKPNGTNISYNYFSWAIGEYWYLDEKGNMVEIDDNVYALSDKTKGEYGESIFFFTIENDKVVPTPDYAIVSDPIFVEHVNKSIGFSFIFEKVGDKFTQEQIDSISNYGVLSKSRDECDPVTTDTDNNIDVYIYYNQLDYTDCPFLGTFCNEYEEITIAENYIIYDDYPEYQYNYKATEDGDDWIIDVYGMEMRYDKKKDRLICYEDTSDEYKLNRKDN